MPKIKRHLDRLGVPSCSAKSIGALLVDERRHVTCENCKRLWAREAIERFDAGETVH